MILIFLDANVIFSSSAEGSGFAKFFDLILARSLPVTSDFALEEARRNIVAKRPKWVSGFERVRRSVRIVPSVSFPLGIELENKDVPILCSAIRSACDFLVTGDKRHFGKFYGKTIEGGTIVPPIEMARQLTAGIE